MDHKAKSNETNGYMGEVMSGWGVLVAEGVVVTKTHRRLKFIVPLGTVPVNMLQSS